MDYAENDKTRMSIPVIEEQIHFGKQIVETAKITITKKVVEETTTVDTSTTNQKINIERVAVNKFVDTAPDVRYEGTTMIIPVLNEVVVTEKKLLLVEEVYVFTSSTNVPAEENIIVRKEEIFVNRVPIGSSTM